MAKWDGCSKQLQQVIVQPGVTQKQISFPSWATFLVWAGYWLSTNQYSDRRILMTILLPTRACCSAFCALGGLIGRASSTPQSDLTFDAFSSLPAGTEIYLKQNGTPLTGVVGDEVCMYGETLRRVSIVSGGKDMKSSSFYLNEQNFASYEVSLVPHATGNTEVAIRHALKFYEGLTGRAPKTWIRKKEPEIALWTNKAGWEREIEGLRVATSKQQKPVLIEDLLLLKTKRVLLKSSRTKTSRYHECPLAILDGPESFPRISKVKAKNILMLVERSEYTAGGGEATLAEIAGYGDKSLMDKRLLGAVPEVPQGTEMMITAFGV